MTIQAQILRLLVDLTREMNMAVILITHDLGVVARVADKVAVMYAGELVETGHSRGVCNTQPPLHTRPFALHTAARQNRARRTSAPFQALCPR